MKTGQLEWRKLSVEWERKGVSFRVYPNTGQPLMLLKDKRLFWTFHSFFNFKAPKGAGKRALQDVCHLADLQAMHLYLWCNKRMVNYYKRFGFVVIMFNHDIYHMQRTYNKKYTRRKMVLETQAQRKYVGRFLESKGKGKEHQL